MSVSGALDRSESERLLKLVLSVHKGLIGKEWKKRRSREEILVLKGLQKKDLIPFFALQVA